MRHPAVYWISTVLICLALGAGGVMSLMGGPEVEQGTAHMGFPVWFSRFLGVAYLLAVAAILLTITPRFLREWAYGGIVITMCGAIAAHLGAGDAPAKTIPAAVIIVITLISRFSWAARDARLHAPKS